MSLVTFSWLLYNIHDVTFKMRQRDTDRKRNLDPIWRVIHWYHTDIKKKIRQKDDKEKEKSRLVLTGVWTQTLGKKGEGDLDLYVVLRRFERAPSVQLPTRCRIRRLCCRMNDGFNVPVALPRSEIGAVAALWCSAASVLHRRDKRTLEDRGDEMGCMERWRHSPQMKA